MDDIKGAEMVVLTTLVIGTPVNGEKLRQSLQLNACIVSCIYSCRTAVCGQD